MKESSIIQIGDLLVSSEIVTECFSCDYNVCKGACCIVGDSGAPLLEEEIHVLENEYDNYRPLMRPEGVRRIDETGFFEIDSDGDLVTPLLGNCEECAYSLFEGDNCLCAIERASIGGSCRFPKPISCRLYPIRVSHLSGGLTALNLHRWDICKCAFEKGRRENVRVYEFLRGALVDAFGEEFYEALSALAKAIR